MSLSRINTIAILQDGNCFFRCVSSFVNKKLLNSNRFKNGKIKLRELAALETKNSVALRNFVCQILLKDREKYINGVYYDDEHYNNIDHRIKCMNRIGEFVGLIEIKSAAKAFKLCFNIFVPVYCNETGDFIRYNLISNIGQDEWTDCDLVLEDNHYEILTYIESNIDFKKDTTEKTHGEEHTSIKKEKSKKEYETSDRVLRKKKRIKYN